MASGGRRLDNLGLQGAYLRVSVSNGSAEERSAMIGEIVDFAPQIVWAFLGGTFEGPLAVERTTVLEEAVAALSASGAGDPLYVLGPRSLDDASVRSLAASNPIFRERAVGINASRETGDAVMRPLRARYSEAFPLAAVGEGRLDVSPFIYDAIYYLTYAVAYSSGQDPVSEVASAAALVDSLHAVSDSDQGLTVTVGPGPTGLDVAIPALAQRERLNLVGTTGPGAFDFALQARPSEAKLYCWEADGTRRTVARFDRALDDFDIDAPNCADRLFGAR